MNLEKMNRELLEEVTSLKNQNLNLSKKNKELKKQLTIPDVSQQRELFNAILDFSEELPMCTEDYHRSELWEKYKALNCC